MPVHQTNLNKHILTCLSCSNNKPVGYVLSIFFTIIHNITVLKMVPYSILMASSKTAVSPGLTHWRYCSLTLSNRFVNAAPVRWFMFTNFIWLLLCSPVHTNNIVSHTISTRGLLLMHCFRESLSITCMCHIAGRDKPSSNTSGSHQSQGWMLYRTRAHITLIMELDLGALHLDWIGFV